MRKISTIFAMAALILVFTSSSFAQQHHITYTGTGFIGWFDTEDFQHLSGAVYKPTNPGWVDCQVNFPDSANGMQATRMSITYEDNSATGYLRVHLRKKDRWSGAFFEVAIINTGTTSASPSIRYLNIPKSQMSARGIDNNRYAWYLAVYFNEGGTSMRLHQVTIRYE